MDFTGQAVLVTGGRSGIGQATAVAFAKQGAKVVIAGRSNADETFMATEMTAGWLIRPFVNWSNRSTRRTAGLLPKRLRASFIAGAVFAVDAGQTAH